MTYWVGEDQAKRRRKHRVYFVHGDQPEDEARVTFRVWQDKTGEYLVRLPPTVRLGEGARLTVNAYAGIAYDKLKKDI